MCVKFWGWISSQPIIFPDLMVVWWKNNYLNYIWKYVKNLTVLKQSHWFYNIINLNRKKQTDINSFP